jgi:alpha-beta hydrolase superfamily lysophospholipase
MKTKTALFLIFLTLSLFGKSFETITFKAKDGVTITADLYMKHADVTKPFIVLYHQSQSSRGEYREIAPKLNKLGFNCMAIDQRSGDGKNDVDNQTVMDALEKDKEIEHTDAEIDLVSALEYARSHYAKGKLIGWGSSYSSALILKIAGDDLGIMDGVMAFSPAEYFLPRVNIAASAKQIKILVFVAAAKDEERRLRLIYDVITSPKTLFLPVVKGAHGSSALYEEQEESKQYWEAVEAFLKSFL